METRRRRATGSTLIPARSVSPNVVAKHRGTVARDTRSGRWIRLSGLLGHGLTAEQACARFGSSLERLWKDRRWQPTLGTHFKEDHEILWEVDQLWDELHLVESQQAASDELARLEEGADRNPPLSDEALGGLNAARKAAASLDDEVSETLRKDRVMLGFQRITLWCRQAAVRPQTSPE